MSKLKPCPFCGEAPEEHDGNEGEQFIGCTNESCEVYCFQDRTKDWNTRPIEDAQAEQITRLKEELRIWEQNPDY